MQVSEPGGWKLARKKSLAVGVACIVIFWPAQGFNGRTFELYVLNRWDLNFCVRSPNCGGGKAEQRTSWKIFPKCYVNFLYELKGQQHYRKQHCAQKEISDKSLGSDGFACEMFKSSFENIWMCMWSDHGMKDKTKSNYRILRLKESMYTAKGQKFRESIRK